MLYEDIRQKCKEYHLRFAQYDRAYNRFFSKWDCHEQIDEVEIKRLERFLGLFGAFDHDRYVKIDAEAFKPTLQKVLQMLADADLKDLTILDDFMGHRQLIQEAFDTLNDFQFTQYPYYYSTAYSKILHAINPNFFVMLDRHIRKKYRLEGEYRKGHGYANLFLPKMQEVAQQAVAEVMEKENLSHQEAVRSFTEHCKYNNSLAKIIDEYNFVISR